MNLVRYTLALAAAAGLLACAAWSAAAWLGHSPITVEEGMPLLLGVFVVFAPAVHQLQEFSNVDQKQILEVALIGAPRWMRWIVNGSLTYGLGSFGVAMVLIAPDGEMPPGLGIPGPLMAFYAMSMGVLYAAARRHELGIRWLCANGHRIAPTAKFCPECGAAAGPVAATDR